jgi:uncharacterized protein (TIGR00255 family)
MTGYGGFTAERAGREIAVEIKSVNHKFFECFVRAGRSFGFLEEKIKKHCGSFISRGKVEVNVNITATETDDVKITANKAVLDGYLSAARAYQEVSDLNFDPNEKIGFYTLFRIPDGFIVGKDIPDEETIWEDVKYALDGALIGFNTMRSTEGEKLRDDIGGRLTAIERYVHTVDVLSPESVSKYRTKLTDKLRDTVNSVMGEHITDITQIENRILTEAAIFAEKTAVFEETVRLKSHIGQFRSFLTANEPIGRKMDFLTQEMNREANTIGSKAQDLEITRLVLDIKSDIEKIREQVQNIE